jgi:gliding motility-associated-like protein
MPLKKVILILSVFLFSSSSYAQLTVDRDFPYDNISFLINEVFLSDDLPISNLNYKGDSIQLDFFNGANSNIGFDSGIVMGTGDIAILDTSFDGIGDFVNPIVTDPDLLDVVNSLPSLIGQNFNVSTIHDVAVLEFEISVYSRWGQKVFYSNSIEHQWDGTYKGKKLPTGVYTYAVTIYGKDAEIFKQNGYVNLVR